MYFILKLSAHMEWHIVNCVDNVLYCHFDCCCFCLFVLGFLGGSFCAGFWVSFSSTCYCCFMKWGKGISSLLPLSWTRKKIQLYSLRLFCIRKQWMLYSCFFLFLATEISLSHILKDYLFQNFVTQILFTCFCTWRVKRSAYLPRFMESYCELLCRYV